MSGDPTPEDDLDLTGPLRIAVTGGAGFIGSHVVDRLVDAGHDVTVLDIRQPHRADVSFKWIDVSDADALTDVFSGIDVVFHLAGVANVNDAFERPLTTVDVNITGTANVWEAARRNQVRRTVLASTVWVYAGANGPGPFDEDTPFHVPHAGHIYTSSKIAAEMIVHNYAELYDVPFTILRYGIPFGPRMRDELVIPQFVRRALDGEPLMINGDGGHFRNYVYVLDIADAHLRALRPAGRNEVFNLEGREKVTVQDLAEAVRTLVGDQVVIEHRESRAGDYEGKEVSADKALELLGWRASTPFEEGLGRYVEWYTSSRASGA